MNHSVSPNTASFRIEYYRYRGYIVPSVVLIVCFLLFFQIIIPQIQNFFNLQVQIQNSRIKVAALHQNVNNLSTIDEDTLNKELHVVAKALPADKDFLGILSVINNAGVTSGVSINDYAIQGDTGTIIKNKQAVQLTVSVLGNLDTLKKFIAEIKNQFPLSDITEIRTTNNQATITVAFFYKPFPNLQFSPDAKIQTLSPNEEGLITTLTTYDKTPDTTDTTIIPETEQ